MHLLKPAALPLFAVVLTVTGAGVSAADEAPPLIGESVCVYTLADDNTEVRGLAFDGASAGTPRLFVLDHSGLVFAYGFHQETESEIETLELLQTYDLAAIAGSSGLASPRGLAFAVEHGRGVLYFLDWEVTADDSR